MHNKSFWVGISLTLTVHNHHMVDFTVSREDGSEYLYELIRQNEGHQWDLLRGDEPTYTISAPTLDKAMPEAIAAVINIEQCEWKEKDDE